MRDSIIKERTLNHPIDIVWKAITNAEEITKWFLRADFKAEKGYNYVFNSTGEDCSPIKGTVLEASPYQLTYTWIVEENPIETIVTWTLEPIDGGTKLILSHTGITNYAGETAVAMFTSFDGGWDNCIAGLVVYLKPMIHAG